MGALVIDLELFSTLWALVEGDKEDRGGRRIEEVEGDEWWGYQKMMGKEEKQGVEVERRIRREWAGIWMKGRSWEDIRCKKGLQEYRHLRCFERKNKLITKGLKHTNPCERAWKNKKAGKECISQKRDLHALKQFRLLENWKILTYLLWRGSISRDGNWKRKKTGKNGEKENILLDKITLLTKLQRHKQYRHGTKKSQRAFLQRLDL